MVIYLFYLHCMVAGWTQVIKEQANERWRDIAEQRLTRYKCRHIQRHRMLYSISVACFIICAVLSMSVYYGPVQTVTIDYTECTDERCTYIFAIDRTATDRKNVYVKVRNMPQKHMSYEADRNAYTDTSIANIERYKPYIKNGKWVYPCGLLYSTYPHDIYTITTEQGAYIGTFNELADDTKTQYSIQSWVEPSMFSDATTKIGEIDDMQKGRYIMTVQKTQMYPEDSRQVILVSNLSVFGSVLYSIQYPIIISALSLIVINYVAYRYRL